MHSFEYDAIFTTYVSHVTYLLKTKLLEIAHEMSQSFRSECRSWLNNEQVSTSS